jgi:hypothetical protein
MANGPGPGGIALRALAALVLVFSTYNPDGYSFYHWTLAPLLHHTASTGPASLKFLAGVVLVTATAYITLNLLADLAYFAVNPRLRS